MSAPLGPGTPDENDASTQATPADPLQLSGPELEPEEMAALAAVLEAAAAARAEAARLAAEAADPRPLDRTLRRRGDLGLWARPGRGQWRQGAGPQ
ncbi:hypothetical protein [Micrococcus luteus]|uniref:hypothetical protein n=1 Tax=Micrococcus luteus TaxID=1270 RepID=UPI000A6608B9|nr:hypothetical protein [Micrococcus luteus]MCV7531789.1 hypothetical protein [Micrococcus luteus]